MARDQWLRIRASRIGRRRMARQHTGSDTTPQRSGPRILRLARLSPRAQLLINIGLCVLSGLALALAVRCFVDSERARTWELARREPPQDTVVGTRVTDRRGVARVITGNYERGAYPFQVPTGVQLQGVRFPGGHNVEVSGYIWMHYPKEIPDSVPRNFTLPEAQGTPRISQVYHKADSRGEDFGWTFSTTLRQNFDYAKYPLDRHSIWIRILPAGKLRSVIAVPDFASYPPWRDELLHQRSLVTPTGNRALLWRENLLPALLFWPILTGVLFAVTIMTFQF